MTAPERVLLARCMIDLAALRVVRADREHRLTELEARFLRALARRPDEDVPRGLLLQEVWGLAPESETRAIDVLVSQLRKKLEPDPRHPTGLVSVHGVGYRLVPDARGEPDDGPLVVPGGLIELSTGRVRVDGRESRLTTTEKRVLQALRARKGQPVERHELLASIWRRSDTRALDHAVRRLRAKIEKDPRAPTFLVGTRLGGLRLALATPPSPSPSTPLVGRDADRDALVQLVLAERLIVVVGPGGVGKSSLVDAAAVYLQPSFPGGTVTCALADTHSEEGVLWAIARACGAVVPHADRATVTRVLAERPNSLVVLDNVEQLVATIEPLLEHLLAATRVHIVCTSRVRLHSVGAHILPLGALAPDATLELLVRVASRARPTAGPPPAALVPQLMDALDGIPLAITIAGARVAAATWEELAQDLESLAHSVDRAQDVRHQTLAGVFRQSWDLLRPEVRQALHALVTFVGGFDRAAARAVLGAEAARLDELVDHSLVEWVEPLAGVGRFRVLQLVKQLVVETAGPPTSGAAAARHFASLVAPTYDAVQGLQLDPTRTRRLQLDTENLAQAVQWGLAHGAADVAAGAMLALVIVSTEHGPFEPVARLQRRVLDARPSDAFRVWLALSAARIHAALDDLATIDAQVDEVLPLCDDAAASVALDAKAMAAFFRGDRGAARALQARALALAEGTGDPVSTSLRCTGMAQLEADPRAAVAWAERSLRAANKTSNAFLDVKARLILASMTLRSGDVHRARWLHRDVVAVAEQLGLASTLGQFQRVRAAQLIAWGDLDATRDAIAWTREPAHAASVTPTDRALIAMIAAELAWVEGDHARAYEEMERALQTSLPTTFRAAVLVRAGELYLDLGRQTRAAALVTEMLRETEGLPHLRAGALWIAHAVGRPLPVQQVLEELAQGRARVLPIRALAWLIRAARLYAALGHITEARGALAEADALLAAEPPLPGSTLVALYAAAKAHVDAAAR